MQHLEFSCAVRRFFKSLGFKGLTNGIIFEILNVIEQKIFVLIFAKNLSEIFLILCRIQRDMIKKFMFF